MSIDGAQNNVDQAANAAYETIVDGIRNNSLLEAVASADQGISSAGLDNQQKFEVSRALGSKLQDTGLLPRVLVDYSTKGFESLSNGDNYINSVDLDTMLQAQIESQAPVKGMLARQLRSNLSSIALSHTDTHVHHDDTRDDSEEIGKGISKKDLRDWGKDSGKDVRHADMSARMVSYFGNTQTWNDIAGQDNLLSKDELDLAKQDTTRFHADEINTLSYMRDNFGGIRASSSGDAHWKMSLSDVLEWSKKHGVSSEIAQPKENTRIAANMSAADPIGSNANLGLSAIHAGLNDGSLTANIKMFDKHLMDSGLNAGQINEVENRIREGLSANQLLRRTMGEYGLQNFDALNVEGRGITLNDLDAKLQGSHFAKSPTERMLASHLRHNADRISMASDDVRHDNSDDAEKRRGMTKDDLTNLKNEDIEDKSRVDMSKEILRAFGNMDGFNRLAQGDNKVSKDDLDAAKADQIKFNVIERATASYMRDNYGSIKSANSGDGGKITISDVVNYAAKNGVTAETLRLEDEAMAARQKPAEVVQERVEAPAVRRDDQVKVVPEKGKFEAPKAKEANMKRYLGEPTDEITFKLNEGDRIWDMAMDKYGAPVIEAIFEKNGMTPTVSEENGLPVISDPTYKAGDSITLPSSEEIPQLTEAYRVKAKQLRDQLSSRAGEANQATEVKLMYGDTLSQLAFQKYGKHVPVEALYAANNLAPRVMVEQGTGRKVITEPIYFAGKKYVLPPIDQVNALAQAYRQKYFQ